MTNEWVIRRLVAIRGAIGVPPSLRLALSEEAEGKSMQQCEQINDVGIIVNFAFIPLTAANKARGCCTS